MKGNEPMTSNKKRQSNFKLKIPKQFKFYQSQMFLSNENHQWNFQT